VTCCVQVFALVATVFRTPVEWKGRKRQEIIIIMDVTAAQMGAVIRGKEPATSISFHSDGVHLFVASERDQRQKGTSDQPAIRFEREGIRLVEST
jgi:hypothetical protein